MRILVIDDDPVQQASARETLVGHEVTIVGTHSEARELLEEPWASHHEVQEELLRRGFKDPHAKNTTEQEAVAALEEQSKIEQALRPPASFDVVLCDLIMPASSYNLGGKGCQYVGEPMPVGFGLALMAVIHGAKFVAVVTDTNHHHHPAATMLDEFDSRCPPHDSAKRRGPRFVMNGARVGFYHSWAASGLRRPPKEIPKNWGLVLQDLLGS